MIHRRFDLQRLLSRFLTLVFLPLVISFGASATRAQDGSSLSAETVKRIEAIIESEKAKLGIPGLSVAIAVDNKIQYAKGFGWADVENSVPVKPATAFRTASIAKALTATAVMQLVEQGKIELDAPIQKYCAAFPEKSQPITVRHLLTHQSGIRHYKNRLEAATPEHYASVSDSLKAFKDEPLLFEPGARFSYTTYGYSVLGCVIEGASGMSYEAYMAKNIFQPSGMERTRIDDVFAVIRDRARGYIKIDVSSLLMLSEGARKQVKAGEVINAPLHDTSVKIPGGGLLSTATDLAKFAIAVNTGKLVKRATLEQMWTEQKAKDGKATSYGFGWEVFQAGEQKVVLHGGNQAGARSQLGLMPAKGFVIVVMTNLSDANLAALTDGIRDAVLGVTVKQ
jgi:CubicO group peptidase (beta-lactamase class C family)